MLQLIYEIVYTKSHSNYIRINRTAVRNGQSVICFYLLWSLHTVKLLSCFDVGTLKIVSINLENKQTSDH